MLLLLPGDTLEVVTDAAVPVDVHASFMDLESGEVTPGRANTAITTAATTPVVADPGAGKTRNVKTLHIRNKDAALPVGVTVVHNSATNAELRKTTLKAGEELEYVEGVGFFTLEQKQVVEQVLRKGSDQIHALTSYGDITGLTFTLLANAKYRVEYDLVHQSAAVTTGIGFAVTGPAAPSALSVMAMTLGARTAATAGAFGSYAATAYDQPNLFTTAVEAANTDYASRMHVYIETGASGGDLIPRVRAEVAANVTVRAGSFAYLKRIS